MTKKKKIVIGAVLIILVGSVTILYQTWKEPSRLDACKDNYTADCYDIMMPSKEYREKRMKEWNKKNPGKNL